MDKFLIFASSGGTAVYGKTFERSKTSRVGLNRDVIGMCSHNN